MGQSSVNAEAPLKNSAEFLAGFNLATSDYLAKLRCFLQLPLNYEVTIVYLLVS